MIRFTAECFLFFSIQIIISNQSPTSPVNYYWENYSDSSDNSRLDNVGNFFDNSSNYSIQNDLRFKTLNYSENFLFTDYSKNNFSNQLIIPNQNFSTKQNLCIERSSVISSMNYKKIMPIYDKGRFHNPFPTWKNRKVFSVIKFLFKPSNISLPRNRKELEFTLPVIKPILNKELPKDSMRVSWLGHSTVLVQFEELTILTDPIFSNHAQPLRVGFVKRYRPAPIKVKDLPQNLSIILISHNHYDHLDSASVRDLHKKYSTSLSWFVPLGLKEWFTRKGIQNVFEMNWWQEHCLADKSDSKIIFLPAQHWSRRSVFDENKSLWGSWAVLGLKSKFYFAGDTGYNSDLFKSIGQEYGPFNLSAIPIGAYEPNSFLKYQHVNPEEAVNIHEDINSKLSIAIHWGTFPLSDEYYLDPPKKLRDTLDARGIPSKSFLTLQHGETKLIDENGITKKENLSQFKPIF